MLFKLLCYNAGKTPQPFLHISLISKCVNACHSLSRMFLAASVNLFGLPHGRQILFLKIQEKGKGEMRYCGALAKSGPFCPVLYRADTNSLGLQYLSGFIIIFYQLVCVS